MALRPWRWFGWLVVLLWGATAASAEQERLVVYSSMKEALLDELASAFSRRHPEIRLEHQNGGAARLMAKLTAERESGKIQADVLWSSELADYYRLKSEGALQRYIPAESKALANPFADYDGSFTAARFATLGIVFNNHYVKDVPKTWHDAYKPAFKDAFGLINPSLSGVAYLGVAMLLRNFGWSYFEALHANGARLARGSTQLVEEAAAGDMLAGLAVDVAVFDRIDKGGQLAMAYPAELIVIPTPIAIIRNGPNPDAAKAYVDFVLSNEGQTILAGQGMLPVRTDVVIPDRYNLPPVADALKRAAKTDYPRLLADREATIRHFAEIMQKEVTEKADKR